MLSEVRYRSMSQNMRTERSSSELGIGELEKSSFSKIEEKTPKWKGRKKMETVSRENSLRNRVCVCAEERNGEVAERDVGSKDFSKMEELISSLFAGRNDPTEVKSDAVGEREAAGAMPSSRTMESDA